MMITLDGTPVPTSHCVYVGADLGCVLVKVGLSGDRKRRGGELKIHPLCAFPGLNELDERRLMRRWDRCRIGDSEWFRPDDEMLADILRWIRPGDIKALAVLQRLARSNDLREAA